MTIRFTFRDGIHPQPGTCDLEIHGNIVVCTAIPQNTGPSITNSCEVLAGLVCDRFAIQKEDLVWIEHYNPSSYKGKQRDDEEWALVTFKIEGWEFTEPEWRPLTEEEKQKYLGGDDKDRL